MKTTLLTLLVGLAPWTTLVGQGTVRFDNNIPGVIVSQVFYPSPVDSITWFGNGPTDYPPGTTDWSLYHPVSGGGISAQLFAAPGADAPGGSLLPASPITTFRTGEGAGHLIGSITTLAGVPADTPVATVQLRVWENLNGQITDWDTALARPFIAVGTSLPFNVQAIGGVVNPPAALTGLVSFNLRLNNSIPEPSPVTLIGLAVAVVFLVRNRDHYLRRKK